MGKDKNLRCNRCGRQMKVENDIMREDAFEAKKEWGYFSNKDLEVHEFLLCEDCYDSMVAEFVIPVEMQYKREVMGNDRQPL